MDYLQRYNFLIENYITIYTKKKWEILKLPIPHLININIYSLV